MSESRKFDQVKLAKLNDPKRLEIPSPEVIWAKADLKNPEILVDIGAGTGFLVAMLLFIKIYSPECVQQ